MTIGQRIKQRRKELGLTQTELAHKLGNKSKVSVCTVENDKEDLTTDRIRKYAIALECSPAYLMGWIDTPHSNRLNNTKLLISDGENKPYYEIEIRDIKPDKELVERISAYVAFIARNSTAQALIDAARHSSEDDVKLATEFLMRLNKGNEKDEG